MLSKVIMQKDYKHSTVPRAQGSLMYIQYFVKLFFDKNMK